MADHPSSRRLNSLTASSPTQSTKQQQHRHSHWRHDFPLSFSLFSTYKDIPAMSELEGRSRPIQRHTGFDVGSSADVSESSRSARIRTTTNGTIVKGSDGDIDMSDDKVSAARCNTNMLPTLTSPAARGCSCRRVFSHCRSQARLSNEWAEMAPLRHPTACSILPTHSCSHTLRRATGLKRWQRACDCLAYSALK